MAAKDPWEMHRLRTAIDELEEAYWPTYKGEDTEAHAEYEKKRAELVANLEAWFQENY